MKKLLILALILLPAVASAQYRRRAAVEVTPFAGYRWGGTIEADQSPIFGEDVEVDDASSYGLTLDIPVGYNFAFELLASRQNSTFITDEGLFGGDEELADVTVSYYHAGVIWHLDTPSREVRPFLTLSLGTASLDPDIEGVSSESRLSGSFGGGAKLMFSDHVGVRLEGRGLWIDVAEDDDDDCWRCDEESEAMTQGEVSAGLVVRF